MITHIKRSIPDLRAVKHQPLENKESPCGSPKHHSCGGGGGGDNGVVAGTSGVGKSIAIRNQMAFGLDGLGCCEKDADAVTLSAIQTTSCTCGPNKAMAAEHVTLATQMDKTSGDLDDEDAMLSSSGGHHHHYHYHPYQQHQQHQPLPHHHHHQQQQQYQQQQQQQQQPPSHQSGHEVR